MTKIKIRKGDKVLVLAGKDRGKTGTVERVVTKTKSVIIPKINVTKKHVKATKKNPAGGLVDVEKPLLISKIQLICPACGKKTRVSYEIKGKEKKRICNKCNAVVENQKTEAKEK